MAKSRARIYDEEKKVAEARAAMRIAHTDFILPNHLQELRTDKFLSQADLARKIGVCKSTVSMWEAGVKGIKDKNKVEICKVLGCDITTLFDWGI